MADLSKPNEAAEWAWSWLNAAEVATFTLTPELLTHRRERAVARVQEAIDRLSRTQPERCSQGIAAMCGALAMWREQRR